MRTTPSIAAMAAVLLAACGAQDAASLPKLQIDADRVTVSGISSGAIMAHQVHVAWSRLVDGAGIVSGPPYGCSEGKMDVALKRCVAPKQEGPDTAALVQVVRDRAAKAQIDPVEGIAGDRVWVFHGTGDTVVSESVTAATADLYEALGADVEREFSQAAAHVFPTLATGGDCGAVVSPFIGKCGYDAAGEIFRRVVGGVQAPAAQATGELVAFDQRPFAAEGADPVLGGKGFLYIPPQCKSGSCGLHIAFHGCQQSEQQVGDAFAAGAGYNAWADAADVVVLYPQTRSSMMPLNPKACWDWWGVTGAEFDTRQGAQLRWLANVLAALGVKV